MNISKHAMAQSHQHQFGSQYLPQQHHHASQVQTTVANEGMGRASGSNQDNSGSFHHGGPGAKSNVYLNHQIFKQSSGSGNQGSNKGV